jgi:hypothetical protein
VANLIWRASNRYPFWEWDSLPEKHSFSCIPTKMQREALTVALEYFIDGEKPPEED